MQETINDIIREMRLGHTINVDGGAYLIGYADTPPNPVHPIATYNIHRVTVAELADRLERATDEGLNGYDYLRQEMYGLPLRVDISLIAPYLSLVLEAT